MDGRGGCRVHCMFSGISHVYSRTRSGTGESQLPHQIKRRAISNAGSPIARRYLVMEPRLVIYVWCQEGHDCSAEWCGTDHLDPLAPDEKMCRLAESARTLISSRARARRSPTADKTRCSFTGASLRCWCRCGVLTILRPTFQITNQQTQNTLFQHGLPTRMHL